MKKFIHFMALGLCVAVATSGLACVKHIKPYEAKRRKYEPPVPFQQTEDTHNTQGSLWQDRGEGGTLFTDVRAFKVNDIVTIQIQETASADRKTSTSTDHDAGMEVGGDVNGILSRNLAGDPMKLVAGLSKTDFAANGKTSRTDEVEFTIAATITRVFPNGNLFIEGHRVVLVNSEEHHFYISGVARPQDIERDNSIVSYKLADAQVEFTGRGVISEGQDPGWLTRAMNYASPF